MKIADVDLKEYSVGTTTPIRTSIGESIKRDGLIVIVHSQDGMTGLGEIAPLDGYSRESLSDALSCASMLAENLVGADIPESLEDISLMLDRHSQDCGPLPSSVRFGFETALADLLSRSFDIPLSDWLAPDSIRTIPVNALVTNTGPRMIDEINELISSGYNCLKLKVGGRDPIPDATRVALVRETVGPQIQIRLDANRSWNLDQATEFLRQVRSHGIEYVEEPLADPDIASYEKLYDSCGVTIAIDETVQDIDRWTRLLSCRAVEAVVIKPTIAGGLAASLNLMRKVVAVGKKVVVSSTFETGVGLAACLHLAATLGENIQPCGFDTIRYLTENLIDVDLKPRGGFIDVPGSLGLGVELDPDSGGWT